MKRVDFLKRLAIGSVVLVPVVSALNGCSSGGDDPAPSTPSTPSTPTTGTCGTNGTITSIQLNHGHSISIPKEDVIAGDQKTYSIEGTATHAHSVTVTKPQFALLASGIAISIDSSSANSHTHSVSISCA